MILKWACENLPIPNGMGRSYYAMGRLFFYAAQIHTNHKVAL